jgi:hypothetical protein
MNKEIKVAQVKLNGVAREIQIERYSPAHQWQVSLPVRVVCKFPSNGKKHGIPFARVVEVDGEFRVKSCQPFRNSNNAFPVAWDDEIEANSGWTGDKKAA